MPVRLSVAMVVDLYRGDPGYLRVVTRIPRDLGRPGNKPALKFCAELTKLRKVVKFSAEEGRILASVEQFTGRRGVVAPPETMRHMLFEAIKVLHHEWVSLAATSLRRAV